MKYVITFVLFFVPYLSSAEGPVLKQEWIRANEYSWFLDMTKTDKRETIVLMKADERLYFTSYTDCKVNVYSKMLTWENGAEMAKGFGCYGQYIQESTEQWRAIIYPLPDTSNMRPKKKYPFAFSKLAPSNTR